MQNPRKPALPRYIHNPLPALATGILCILVDGHCRFVFDGDQFEGTFEFRCECNE